MADGGKRLRIGAWVGGLIGGLCLVAVMALPVPAEKDCEANSDEHFEEELITVINAERSRHRLKSLVPDSKLKAAARAHSVDMARNGRFSHTGSDGSSVSSRVAARKYRFSAIGENIGFGHATPKDVLAEWMGSPRHRANVLGPSFTEIGTGHACLSENEYRHYWTAVFGSP